MITWKLKDEPGELGRDRVTLGLTGHGEHWGITEELGHQICVPEDPSDYCRVEAGGHKTRKEAGAGTQARGERAWIRARL